LCLRKAEGATATSLRFAVYIETEGGAQVSVFKLLVVDRHLHLEHVHSHPCRYEGDMVEMYCTNTAIWAIWKVRDGDVEDTVVQHFSYDGGKCHGWQSAHLSSPPPRDIYLPHNAEPRSIYLEALFHPGRFATSAINKALELYGNTSVKESIQQLREEATATVERELRSSSDSTQLQHEQFRELQVKCWMKFYGCCYEYQQLMSQPVGVFEDPTTGLVCLFKEEMFSFMYPASSADCLAQKGALIANGVSSEDVSRVMEAARITTCQLNTETLESLLISVEPAGLAAELSEAIADIPSKENMLDSITQILSCVPNVSDVVICIASALDPTFEYSTVDSQDVPDAELQLKISQLFSSPLCERLLAACVREACLTRMSVARDILLLICLLQHGREMQAVDQSLVNQFSSLLQNYCCLYWLCCRCTIPASPSSLESNLRQLAALNISTTSSIQPLINRECSVLELYVHGVEGQGLRAALLGALPSGVALFPMWTQLLPLAVSILLSQLWPSTNSVPVCQFLLSSCQYTHLQVNKYMYMYVLFCILGWYSMYNCDHVTYIYFCSCLLHPTGLFNGG
jgi:nuclear pore complex protein Nup160